MSGIGHPGAGWAESTAGAADVAAAVRDGAEAAVAPLRTTATADATLAPTVALGTLTVRLPHGASPRDLADAVRRAIERRLR